MKFGNVKSARKYPNARSCRKRRHASLRISQALQGERSIGFRQGGAGVTSSVYNPRHGVTNGDLGNNMVGNAPV